MAHSGTKEYDELKASGVSNPEAHMLKNGNRAGQYQGCFSKSHWGGRRMADKWNVFIKHAPNLSKRVMEVPNSLRPSLGIKALQKRLAILSHLLYLNR